jgi:hypothetical protein
LDFNARPCENLIKWSDRLEELKALADQNGHARAPNLYPENPQLGQWVANQRTQYRYYKEGKTSKLNEAKVKQLEAAGFYWKDITGHGPLVDAWEKRLEELKRYQEENNTIGVLHVSPLSTWYHYQRSQYQQYKEGGSTTVKSSSWTNLILLSSSYPEIKSGIKWFFN